MSFFYFMQVLRKPPACVLYADSMHAILRLRLGSYDDMHWRRVAAGHLRANAPVRVSARWLAKTYTLECASEYIRQCLWCVGDPDRHEVAHMSHMRLRALIVCLQRVRETMRPGDPCDPLVAS